MPRRRRRRCRSRGGPLEVGDRRERDEVGQRQRPGERVVEHEVGALVGGDDPAVGGAAAAEGAAAGEGRGGEGGVPRAEEAAQRGARGAPTHMGVVGLPGEETRGAGERDAGGGGHSGTPRRADAGVREGGRGVQAVRTAMRRSLGRLDQSGLPDGSDIGLEPPLEKRLGSSLKTSRFGWVRH